MAKSVIDSAVTASQHILDSLKTSALTMTAHTEAWMTSIAAAQATQQDLETTALAFSTRFQSLPSEEMITARVDVCDKCFDRALKIPTDQEVRNDISNQVEDICDDYITEYVDSQSHNILHKIDSKILAIAVDDSVENDVEEASQHSQSRQRNALRDMQEPPPSHPAHVNLHQSASSFAYDRQPDMDAHSRQAPAPNG